MFQEDDILGSINEEAPHKPTFVFRIYTFHGHALCACGYSYTASSSSTSNEWLIDDISLSVVGSGIVPVENGHFSDVLCVPKISSNLLSVYQITHSGEGKTVTFTPHQVVIKDFKNPQNVLATGNVDDITRLYKFNNFGSLHFSSVFVAHSDNLRKLWHERFGHLNYRSL